jgi:hypothetical protein
MYPFFLVKLLPALEPPAWEGDASLPIGTGNLTGLEYDEEKPES